MTEIRLPFSITYETKGVTPVTDVIEALKATNGIVSDAVSLLPSIFDGLRIEESSLNVRTLTQESPLREIFFISIFLAFQEDLEQEVPTVIEDLFKVTVGDNYDTIVTVAVMAVAFYGAGLAIDAAKKTFADSLPLAKFEELIQLLALETGKAPSDLREIIQARFGKPAAAKRLIGQAKRIFLPSQRESNAPVLFDRHRISSEILREIPYVGEAEEKSDFDRYEPHYGVDLELHAQDRDRSATGWAAVASAVSDKRLKVRVMDPVEPSEIWGKDQITADIVVVLKLTSDGYQPAEIQITEVISSDEDQSGQ